MNYKIKNAIQKYNLILVIPNINTKLRWLFYEVGEKNKNLKP